MGLEYMKIYLAHATRYDFKKELYEPLKNSSLVKKHDIEFLFDRKKLPESTKEIIQNSDLILAEVSYPSLGEGIELGWANLLKKPIICFYKKGQLGSKFITMITQKIIEYKTADDMVKKLEKIL